MEQQPEFGAWGGRGADVLSKELRLGSSDFVFKQRARAKRGNGQCTCNGRPGASGFATSNCANGQSGGALAK